MSILITDTFIPSAGGFAMVNLEDVWTKDATTKTLSGDTFTMDSGAHRLTAETGLTDDLDGIEGHGGFGRLLVIRAVTNTTITLKDENAGASAADRIRTIGGGDQAITEDEPALLWYDAQLSRWVVLAGPGGGAGHTEDHDHDGAPTQTLLAANTHGSPSTDTHHTEDHAARHAGGGDDEVSVEGLPTAGGAGTAPVGDGGGGLTMIDIATEAELVAHDGDEDAHHPESELRDGGATRALVDGSDLRLESILNLDGPEAVTIASGVATITRSAVALSPEVAATDDDVTDIVAATGQDGGKLVFLFRNDASAVLTLKHLGGAATTQLYMTDAADVVLKTYLQGAWFIRGTTGVWVQATPVLNYGDAGYPADVAAAKADGTSLDVARADHAHAHPPGLEGDHQTAIVQDAEPTPRDGLLWLDTSVSGTTTETITLVSKTGAYTATDSDTVILCDASGGAFTITLPTAVGRAGKVFYIKKTDSSANGVTIDGDGSETIDGATTQVIATQYNAIKIVSDGSEWHIL